MTSEEIRQKFDEGSRQFKELREMIEALSKDMHEAKQASEKTKELVEAWTAIKTGGKFLRWIAGVIASIIAIWAAAKLGFTNWMGK